MGMYISRLSSRLKRASKYHTVTKRRTMSTQSWLQYSAPLFPIHLTHSTKKKPTAACSSSLWMENAASHHPNIRPATYEMGFLSQYSSVAEGLDMQQQQSRSTLLIYCCEAAAAADALWHTPPLCTAASHSSRLPALWWLNGSPIITAARVWLEALHTEAHANQTSANTLTAPPPKKTTEIEFFYIS